jgi:hypothetical protein
MMSKFRLTVYLSASVADRLAIACKRPGANRSKLVDRALDQFLGTQGGQANDAQLLPKSEQDPARALGNQRFEAFVAQIGKRLASGQSSVRDVMERIAANDPDLLSEDFGRGLENAATHQHQGNSNSMSSAMPAGHGRGGEAPAPQRSSASSQPDAVPGASSQSAGGTRG